jgi:predicted enzyme related to lactoylglutathione lyase
MDPVVHFELPADDLQRASTFYRKAFGWQIKPWKNDKMEYWSVVTKKDEKAPGINGGLMPRVPNQPLTVYVAVANIDKALALVAASGGSVCMPKSEIGANMGWIAIVTDTEGNCIGLHQPPAHLLKKSSAKKASAKSSSAKKSVAKKGRSKKK